MDNSQDILGATFGSRLRAWGKKKYKYQSRFAEALKVDYSTLQRYMSDKMKPGKDVLSRLNDLGCDINLLLTGEDEPDLYKKFNGLVEKIKDHTEEYYIRIPRKEYENMNNRITELEEENKTLKKKINSSLRSLQQ